MRPFSRLSRLSTSIAQGLADPQRAGSASARLARLLSLLLVFACAELGVQWGLRLLQPSRAVPGGALQADADAVGALAGEGGRLFGPAPAQPARAPSRYRLYGVIGGGRQAGAALIGVDSEAPQAYPVGAWVAPGVRLLSTGFGRVEIERDGKRSVLETQPDAPGALATPGAVALPMPGAVPGALPTLAPGAQAPPALDERGPEQGNFRGPPSQAGR